MEDVTLRCRRTTEGIYVWLDTGSTDILLTEDVISDPEKADVIESFVNRISFIMYAYRQYKMALNNLLVLCKGRGIGGQVTQIIKSVLNQFNDLTLPGKINREKF